VVIALTDPMLAALAAQASLMGSSA